MTIHFFKDRTQERIDFVELIDGYFAKMPHTEISSDESEVKIQVLMSEFDFSYVFYITKRNKVSSIYRLNPTFININLYLEIPAILPQYIIRKMLSVVGDICQKFDLEIYYDRADNIHQFDMFELLSLLENEKNDYYKRNIDEVSYLLPISKLNNLCAYQSMKQDLLANLKQELVAPNYTMLYNKEQEKVSVCICWTSSSATIIPPELDYIITNIDGIKYMIPLDIWTKHFQRLVSEIKDDNLMFNVSYINVKQATRIAKKLSKMKKNFILFEGYETIKLTNCIEG